MNKLILAIVFSLMLNLYPLGLALAAGTPSVSYQLLGANYNPGGSYSDTTTVSTGQSMTFYVEIINNTNGSSIDNPNVKVDLGGAGQNISVNTTLTASNSNLTSGISDPTTVLINNESGKLVYVPGSTKMTWNDGAGNTYSGSFMPDGITSGGLNIPGSIQYDSAYAVQLSFRVDVVAASSTGSTGGSSASSVCSNTKPGSTALLSANKINSSSVKLTWSKVASASNYSVSYGNKSGQYLYGIDKTGNVNEVVISALDPSQKYFFVVTPINNCTPGDKSNELSANMTGFTSSSINNTQDDQLGVVQSNIEATSSASASAESSEDQNVVEIPKKSFWDKLPGGSKAALGWSLVLILLGLGLYLQKRLTSKKN